MSRYVSYRDFDWVLMIFVLAICALGVLQIHSATEHTKFAGAHVRQIYWVLAGVGAMFLVSLLNYQALLERIHWFYIVSLASLISVLLFGQKYLGARRWIKMPWNVHFQPSEWVKLILILAVAKYFADLHQRELAWSDFIKAGAASGRSFDRRGVSFRQSARPEALSERTAYQFSESGCGPSRLRISSESIADRGRIRGDLGKQSGISDPSRVLAGAANGLHICCI